MFDTVWIADILGVATPPVNLPVTGIAFDTRRVVPGDIFFALPGQTTHGIEFANQALDNGAALIVSDRAHPRGIVVEYPVAALLSLGRYARAHLKGPVIGITGSVGKTTTRVALEAAIAGTGTPGNYNTPLALSATMFRALIGEHEHGARPLVLELGIDHTGEMAELLELTKPGHAVLTAIGASHLDGLGTIRDVATEKVAILANVPGLRVASMQCREWIPKHLAESITFITADTDAQPLPHTPRRLVHGRIANQSLHAFDTRVALPNAGRGVAQAALIGLVFADLLHLPINDAAERMSAVQWEPGRLTKRTVGNLTLLDDSYNSNPLSAREAITALTAESGPHSVVFGSMAELGSISVEEHRAVARLLQDAEQVAIVGEATKPMLDVLPNATFYPNVEALVQGHEWPKVGTLLIKGSRSIGLERAVAHVMELA